MHPVNAIRMNIKKMTTSTGVVPTSMRDHFGDVDTGWAARIKIYKSTVIARRLFQL